MASSKRERQRREARSERRKDRDRLDQGVSPSRVKLPDSAKKSVAIERREQSGLSATKANALVRPEVATPDYKARVTAKVTDARTFPAQHPQTTAFTPSTVTKTPKREERPEKNSSFKKQEHVSSPSARDEKYAHCKKRPDKLTPRRAGGGASKKYVPWCK